MHLVFCYSLLLRSILQLSHVRENRRHAQLAHSPCDVLIQGDLLEQEGVRDRAAHPCAPLPSRPGLKCRSVECPFDHRIVHSQTVIDFAEDLLLSDVAVVCVWVWVWGGVCEYECECECVGVGVRRGDERRGGEERMRTRGLCSLDKKVGDGVVGAL